MRIYSPTHEMDFEFDPDGPSARFDDPNLPSCTAYGPDLFGELVGYEMLEAEVVAPWSLGELGYTNDAQPVHTDGRIENQQHLPDYYAYSPHTDTWEDGLQDIESFDWASDKDNEVSASELSNNNQGEEEVEATSVADTQCLGDQGQNAGPVDREAPNLLEKVDSPTTQPETPVTKPSKAPLSDGTAIVPTESKTSAEHTHPTSLASKLSPEGEFTASHTNILPHVTEKVESGLPAIDERHVEAPDLMDIDDLTIVAETERLNIGPQMQDNVAAEEGPVETYPIPVLHDAEGNMLSEFQSCSGSEDDKAAEALTIPLASASSRHDSLIVHKSNLEKSSQVDTASTKPSTDVSMQPKLHLTSHEVQQTPHNPGSKYDEEAIQSALEALSRIQTQKDRLDNEEQLDDGSAMQIEPATEPLRLPPEALPEVRDSPAHLKADEEPEFRSEPTTSVLPDSSMIIEGDPFSPKSPEALSRVQEDVEGPWQAQLRDAAADSLPSVLSEPLPSKNRDHSDPSISNPPEVAAGDASALSAGPTSELQLESDVALPPLPFPSEDEVRHEESQISPAEVHANEENASAAKLSHRLSKSPALSDVEPNTTVEDNTTVPNIDDSTSVVAIPEKDRMEDVSFAHNLDTTEDLGSTTAVAEPETQPVHPHKRSKASKDTASVSESDSDGPAKKKRKANVASLAKARAVKAANKKPSKASKDQEDESTPPPAKGRRAAAKSKKEATHVDIINEEPTLSTKHGGALKHTGSSAKAPIVVESDDAIISAQSDQGGDSADMDEHYSDVEKPVTPSKQTPAAEIVLGTPLSRPSVSKRELRDLTSTSYRQHPSKAKPISRKLFPPHKPGALGELMSSIPASADSPNVPTSEADSVDLFGDLGVPDTTTKAPKRPASKPRATPAKAVRAKNGPATSGQTKKAPATRTTRRRNAPPQEEEKTKSKEQEEYELSVLFPEPKIDTKGPSPEIDVPSPPKPLKISTKQSILYEPEGDYDAHEDNGDPKSEVEDDDDDFEDAQETIEASADDSDEVDSDTPPPSKKLKLKNKPLMLGGHTIRQTRSRATTTPARSIASKATGLAKNKFGFTPPLTRQAKKAATPAPAPPKPAPKAKAPAKSKAAPEPAKQPSVRKTRQASAMEEEDKVKSKRKLRSGG